MNALHGFQDKQIKQKTLTRAELWGSKLKMTEFSRRHIVHSQEGKEEK